MLPRIPRFGQQREPVHCSRVAGVPTSPPATCSNYHAISRRQHILNLILSYPYLCSDWHRYFDTGPIFATPLPTCTVTSITCNHYLPVLERQ